MIYETPSEPNKKPKRNWRNGRYNTKNKKQRGFGLVEKMFYYYHKIKKAVETVRAEQGYYQQVEKTGGGGSSHAFVSDPTANLAIRRSNPVAKVIINAENINEEVIANPEKWLVVVEQTFMYFNDEELVSDVLNRRFLQNEPIIKTCIDLEITDDKYYRLRDTGIAYARECAIQLGLIKVFNGNL